MPKRKSLPDPRQLSLFSLVEIKKTDDSLVDAIRTIEMGIDTTTWLLIRIGPITYCEKCKSNHCLCPGSPIPLMEHENLKLCDTYENIGEAVKDLAEMNAFPIGSIFVTKNRTAVSCQLSFKMVCKKKSGKVFLREDMPVAEIERLVDWKRVLSIVQLRETYKARVRDSKMLEANNIYIAEQLTLDSVEP